MHDCDLLVFVHIERAAGTTMEHILRRNFFMRHIEVRPLSSTSNGVFSASDLKKTLRFNPLLLSISGHAIYPCLSSLESETNNVKYITLLRDPIQRYISHYQFLVERMQKKISFKDFLANEAYTNLQTKKIAGAPDIEKASEILRERFLLIGIVELFDEFLIMLRRKLLPFSFEPKYQRRNAGERSSLRVKLEDEMSREYQDAILDRNALDIKLYRYAISEIIPSQRMEYGPSLERDVIGFHQSCHRIGSSMLKSYVDYIIRKVYYNLAFGLMRACHGLPYRGCY